LLGEDGSSATKINALMTTCYSINSEFALCNIIYDP